MSVLAIGVATLDIVNRVLKYPRENEKIRALSHYQARGGNAANTLALLSQMGHQCLWGGVLAGDVGGRFVRDSLAANGIDLRHAVTEADGMTPTSYITLSQNGSRTIVHYRQLREFGVEDFNRIDPSAYSWVHFEGRNIPALEQMLARVRQFPALTSSLEVEKSRAGIERLFHLPDVLVFAQDYVKASGYDHAAAFLHQIRKRCKPGSVLFCPWGEEGAYASGRDRQIHHSPAFIPDQVVDTLGAGDVFNAGVIDGLLREWEIEQVLVAACRLSGKKCGQTGFDHLIDTARKR